MLKKIFTGNEMQSLKDNAVSILTTLETSMQSTLGSKMSLVGPESFSETGAGGHHVHSQTPQFLSPYVRWKVTESRRKSKHINEGVSVFTFDLRAYESSSSHLLAELRQLHQALRNDALALQRLRHPNICSVVEPLTDDKKQLSFATKCVRNVVSNCMRSLSVLQVKAGILDIIEALAFLHGGANLAHLAVSPHSIFIDENYEFKLGSLGHSIAISNRTAMMPSPFPFNRIAIADSSGHTVFSEPPIEYAAPEMLTGYPGTCGAPSDMFSLGILIFNLYSTAVENSTNREVPKLRQGNYTSREMFTSQMHIYALPKNHVLPKDIADLVLQLVDPNPLKRPTSAALVGCSCFNHINLKALRFLSNVNEKDEDRKLRFFAAFLDLLKTDNELKDSNLLQHKVLPCLVKIMDPSSVNMAPILMSTLFEVLRNMPPLEPQVFEMFWHKFSHMLTAVKVQVETVVVILSNLELLVQSCTPHAMTELLIFIKKCFSINNEEIQAAVLRQTVNLMEKLGRDNIEEQLLPCILGVLSNELATKRTRICAVESLVCIFPYLTSSCVGTTVLPLVQLQCQSGLDHGLAGAFIKLIEAISQKIPLKQTVVCLVPALCHILIASDITGMEFNECIQVSQTLLKKWQESRVREFHFSEEGENLLLNSMKKSNGNGTKTQGDSQDLMHDFLESLDGATSYQRSFNSSKAIAEEDDKLLSLMTRPVPPIAATRFDFNNKIQENAATPTAIDCLFDVNDTSKKAASSSSSSASLVWELNFDGSTGSSNTTSESGLRSATSAGWNKLSNFAGDPFAGL